MNLHRESVFGVVGGRPKSYGSVQRLRYFVLLGVALLVVILDQSSKALATQQLADGRAIDLFGGMVRLDYTLNSGAAFGIFRTRGALFVIIGVMVSLAILVSYRRMADGPLVMRIALGLILGGALGNLIDRVRLGHVVDFIDLRWWPVFNLADSAIVLGVLCLVFYALFPTSISSDS